MPDLGTSPLRFDDRQAFYDWVDRQPKGRWERENGVVVSMEPERLDHARIKLLACSALGAAIRSIGAPCEAFIDGPAVEIGRHTEFVPDVVVGCGERGQGNALVVHTPVVVVEVLSPSTSQRDMTTKLAGYFQVPSVQHYLLIGSDVRRVIHHSRLGEGKFLTRLHHDGPIELTPPGLTVRVAAFYQGTDLDPDLASPDAPGIDG